MLHINGKWKFNQLIWRFEENGKVKFVHDKKLRKWIYLNLEYPHCYVDVIRAGQAQVYWENVNA